MVLTHNASKPHSQLQSHSRSRSQPSPPFYPQPHPYPYHQQQYPAEMGVGMTLYFEFLRLLIYFFGAAALIVTPIIILNISGDGVDEYTVDAAKLVLTTLGNCGISACDPSLPSQTTLSAGLRLKMTCVPAFVQRTN